MVHIVHARNIAYNDRQYPRGVQERYSYRSGIDGTLSGDLEAGRTEARYPCIGEGVDRERKEIDSCPECRRPEFSIQVFTQVDIPIPLLSEINY